jgi:hypothetical protein
MFRNATALWVNALFTPENCQASIYYEKNNSSFKICQRALIEGAEKNRSSSVKIEFNPQRI